MRRPRRQFPTQVFLIPGTLWPPVICAQVFIRDFDEDGDIDLVVKEIDTLFPAEGDGKALQKGLDKVFEKAVKAINRGATVIILTDRNMDSLMINVHQTDFGQFSGKKGILVPLCYSIV